MVNSSQNKDLIREVKSTKARFISIALLCFLSVAFLSGLRVTKKDMHLTLQDYFDCQNLMDLRIVSTLGLDEENYDSLSRLPDIQVIEGSYSVDEMAKCKEKTLNLKVISLTEKGINNPYILEGRLPENKSECLVDSKLGLCIGDTITFEETENLSNLKYTICGICNHPMYISYERGNSSIGTGKCDGFVLLDKEDFDLDCYTDIYIRFNSVRELNTFASDYEEYVDGYIDQYEDYADSLAEYRTYVVRRDAIEELNDGIRDYNEEIHDAWVELDDGIREYNDGVKEYNDGRAKAVEEFGEAWQDMRDGKSDLDEGNAKLQESKAYYSAMPEPLRSYALAQIAIEEQTIKKGYAEWEDGLATFKKEKKEALQELEDARIELEDAYEELMDGLKEYHDEKADADKELQDAIDEVNDIKDAKVYFLGRKSILDFSGYKSNADNMGNLAKVFPLIFFLVASLVCLTTVTRMIEEQRSIIGLYKALGYTRKQIEKKYITYGLLASIVPSIMGAFLGGKLLPWIIITCWQIMYNFPNIVLINDAFIYSYSSAFAVFAILFTVFLTIRETMKETPANLMRPRTPKAGERVVLEHISFIWKRLSFNFKITFRNLFRYKKRLIMTIFGIGGCMALVVTGFGLLDSVNDIMGIQYNELEKYDAYAVISEDKGNELESFLENNDLVLKSESVYQNTCEFTSGRTVTGYIVAFDNYDDIKDLRTFRDRKTLNEVKMDKEGVYICEKLSEILNLSIGDTFVIDCDEKVEVVVAGIVENHMENYAFMPRSYYESKFIDPGTPNIIYIKFVDGDISTCDKVAAKLLDEECITSITHLSTQKETVQRTFGVINYAVYILIISAAALAFIVLFNLSNLNITERRRELATLKVLGFRNLEINQYILRENRILTLLGIVLGVIMGKACHIFLVKTVELETIMFGRNVHTISYVYAIILTIIFSVVADFISGRKLKDIDMVESLKRVE